MENKKDEKKESGSAQKNVEPLKKSDLYENEENEWPYAEEEDVEDPDGEDTSEAQEEVHIGAIEGSFLISVNLISDLLELLDLTGFGVLIGLVVDFISGPLVVTWLWIRGIPMVSRNAVAQLAEIIPVIDLLPIRTTAIIFTIITVNHPEIMEKMGLAGEITKKIMQAKSKKKV